MGSETCTAFHEALCHDLGWGPAASVHQYFLADILQVRLTLCNCSVTVLVLDIKLQVGTAMRIMKSISHCYLQVVPERVGSQQ